MSLHLESSRAVPVAADQALDLVLPAPLPAILGRRYLAISPVKEVRDQTGEWGSVGQSRTIVQSDGGTVRETLTAIERPGFFTYELEPVSGALKLLASGVAGRWSFEPAGTGTRITWAWDITPASRAAALVLPAFGAMWRGYARQALEDVESLLLG